MRAIIQKRKKMVGLIPDLTLDYKIKIKDQMVPVKINLAYFNIDNISDSAVKVSLSKYSIEIIDKELYKSLGITSPWATVSSTELFLNDKPIQDYYFKDEIDFKEITFYYIPTDTPICMGHNSEQLVTSNRSFIELNFKKDYVAGNYFAKKLLSGEEKGPFFENEFSF